MDMGQRVNPHTIKCNSFANFDIKNSKWYDEPAQEEKNMSKLDESGIKYNSFYDTDKELGFEPRTEEELIEYKRLIGIPLSEDYDELISSLKTDVVRKKEFTEYDFIRLFLSLLTKQGITKIDSVKLGYQLIGFYKIEELEDILVMSIKKQIEGDYVDMSSCINQANFTGLISNPIQSSNERIITISNADDIISSYGKEIVLKMNTLVNTYINISNPSLVDSALELHNELNGSNWDLDSIRRIYSKISVSDCFAKDNPSNCDAGSVTSVPVLKKIIK